jgi:GH25 family lysozyme M1 (1,4-beta-N-acetylmuramidase)
MDSKLKVQVIACVSVIVCMVLGIVVWLNYGQQGKSSKRKTAATAAEQAQSDDASDISVSGGQNLTADFFETYDLDPSKDPYAFLSDESFFEPEKEEIDLTKELSLLVSSTQQDIRVAVVDGNGRLAEGLSSVITVTRVGAQSSSEAQDDGSVTDGSNETTGSTEWKDVSTGAQDAGSEVPDDGSGLQDTDTQTQGDDVGQWLSSAAQIQEGGTGFQEGDAGQQETDPGQNLQQDGREQFTDLEGTGMFYIPDVSAGQYEVALSPVEGYLVEQEPVRVQVSEEISYTVIDDISFLIRSEDEVDALAEDTAENSAEADADGTETNKQLADGASVFGIDVSKWNKEIDWERVKASGVEFAIIRCGYRGSKTGALVEDPYFAKNIEAATQAGVRVGAYFFTQAVTPVEAVEEASMVLMLCRQYQISYPLFIDTEGAGGSGRADQLDQQTRTAVCKAFCETIENAGFTAGVYASKNWFENKLNASELSDYGIWLAQYAGQPSYEGSYDMWQYTSAGTIDGISTLVDFNLSYMDY